MTKKRTRFTLAIEQLKWALTPTTNDQSHESCRLFSTHPQTCPLCGAHVPANTRHECSRRQVKRR